jgi:hypothetical protein
MHKKTIFLLVCACAIASACMTFNSTDVMNRTQVIPKWECIYIEDLNITFEYAGMGEIPDYAANCTILHTGDNLTLNYSQCAFAPNDYALVTAPVLNNATIVYNVTNITILNVTNVTIINVTNITNCSIDINDTVWANSTVSIPKYNFTMNCVANLLNYTIINTTTNINASITEGSTFRNDQSNTTVKCEPYRLNSIEHIASNGGWYLNDHINLSIKSDLFDLQNKILGFGESADGYWGHIACRVNDGSQAQCTTVNATCPPEKVCPISTSWATINASNCTTFANVSGTQVCADNLFTVCNAEEVTKQDWKKCIERNNAQLVEQLNTSIAATETVQQAMQKTQTELTAYKDGTKSLNDIITLLAVGGIIVLLIAGAFIILNLRGTFKVPLETNPSTRQAFINAEKSDIENKVNAEVVKVFDKIYDEIKNPKEEKVRG